MTPLIFQPPSAADRSTDPRPGGATSSSEEIVAPTDGERLMWFRRYRDEAALTEVVEANAAMAWGVCWQVLRHRQDVEDAFQATFMILARKASSICANDSAAGWLYRVALRTALVVRHRRRPRREESLDDDPLSERQQLAAVELSEQRSALLEELRALPTKYQEPLILCHFEGLSRREVAAQLGCTTAAIKGRSARGRRLLRTRLVRRGVSLSAALSALAVQLSRAGADVTPTLVVDAVDAAEGFVHERAASIEVAATIAKEGVLAMSLSAAAKPLLAIFVAGTASVLLAAAVA